MEFLAAGDIVVDTFIKLKDASVHCRLNNEDCEICMRWGDKIPYELSAFVPAVGNASNAAVSAARLGLSTALRAYVGRDAYGAQCLERLQKEGIDTAYMVTQPEKRTNNYYILWYEGQRTILVNHEKFDYSLPTLAATPTWVYFSSFAANSLPYHHAWADYLHKHPEIKLAFQPGTFQIQMGKEALAEIYQRSDIFFCNKEEAERILGLPVGQEIKQLLAEIKSLGPKIAVITDDKRGCYAMDESGAALHCPRYPDPREPYEITGAGDALASTTVAALSLGLPLGEALQWGSANASAVIQKIGAQEGLLTREQLENNLKNPPSDFRVEVLQ